MAADTQMATALLDEAAAIVEAEWMRLEQDEDLWGDVTDLFAEMPAPRSARPAWAWSPPDSAGQANRCPIPRGAGPREAGPQGRYGLPSVLLRETRGVLLKGAVGQGR